MPEHTCPACLSPVSPRATECPYCRARLTPPVSAPATPALATAKPATAQTSPSELGFLRRHVDGRAMYLPLGFRFLAFEIPEARVRRIVGAQKDLVVWSVIVVGGISVVRRYDFLYTGIWLVILGLILILWLPRGCRRVRLSKGDLVPLDLSPAARARQAGKPMLRWRLAIFALLAATGVVIFAENLVAGMGVLLLFGFFAWDSWRCLRALG